LIWKGIQSSPSFHGSVAVELAVVELVPTIVPLSFKVALTGSEVLSVRVRVKKEVAELEPEGPGTSEVMVVVIACRVLFAAKLLVEIADDVVLLGEDWPHTVCNSEPKIARLEKRILVGKSRRCQLFVLAGVRLDAKYRFRCRCRCRRG